MVLDCWWTNKPTKQVTEPLARDPKRLRVLKKLTDHKIHMVSSVSVSSPINRVFHGLLGHSLTRLLTRQCYACSLSRFMHKLAHSLCSIPYGAVESHEYARFKGIIANFVVTENTPSLTFGHRESTFGKRKCFIFMVGTLPFWSPQAHLTPWLATSMSPFNLLLSFTCVKSSQFKFYLLET